MDRPEVLTDLASVERLLPEWRALAASSARSPLEAPDWLLPLARRYLTRYGVRFLAWRDGGELVGVAPLSLIGDRPPLRPIRQLAWWGSIGPRMRGLVDIVTRADARSAVLDSFSAWLDANREWDVLRVLRPQFELALPARLRVEAGQRGWAYADYANLRSTTYQVDLPATLDEWQGVLTSKTRRTMRWQARRYASDQGGEITPVVAGDQLPAALDAVERLLAQRWGASEVYFGPDPSFRGLLHEVVGAMAERGSAWVTTAHNDAGIQAVLVTLAQNGYATSLLVAATADPIFRPFSLGSHIFDEGIREAIQRGCHNYDFLWVGGYKESFWHAQPRLLESAMVGRGIIGRPLARLMARRQNGPLLVTDGNAEGTG